MDRRSAITLAAGVAVGVAVGPGAAEAGPAVATAEDQFAALFLGEMEVTAQDYRALLDADRQPTWKSVKRLEDFRRTYRVGGAGGCAVVATSERGLLVLRYTVTGGQNTLRRLAGGLRAQGVPSRMEKGALVVLANAIPDNRRILHLFVRITGHAA